MEEVSNMGKGDIKVVITIPHHVYDDEEKSKDIDRIIERMDDQLGDVDDSIKTEVIWWEE